MRSITRLVLCFPLLCAAASAVTIDRDTTIDAGNSFPGQFIELIDGASPPTRLTIVNGGVAGEIFALDTTIIDMSGGQVDRIDSESSSSMLLSGGTVGIYTFASDAFLSMSGGTISSLTGTSTTPAEITGGEVLGQLAMINSGGGTMSGLTVGGDATLESFQGNWVVTDTSFQDSLLIAGFDEVIELNRVSVVGDLRLEGTASTTTWSGGSVGGDVFFLAGSELNWTGGSLSGDIEGNDVAVLNVFGRDLEFVGGVLTGFLRDGTPLNTNVNLLGGSQLNLFPEPSTALLFGAVLVALGAAGRRSSSPSSR